MAQFYRPQREDRGRSRLMYITALFIIIFLLDLVAGGRLREVVRVPASYVYISLNHAWEVALDSGIFSSKHKLEIENKNLRDQIAAYKVLDAQYAAMKDENARLSHAISLAE